MAGEAKGNDVSEKTTTKSNVSWWRRKHVRVLALVPLLGLLVGVGVKTDVLGYSRAQAATATRDSYKQERDQRALKDLRHFNALEARRTALLKDRDPSDPLITAIAKAQAEIAYNLLNEENHGYVLPPEVSATIYGASPPFTY